MKHAMTIILLATASAVLAADKPVIHHDVELWFDLGLHHVRILDTVTVPAGVDSLRLNEAFVLIGSDTPMPQVGSVSESLRTFPVAPGKVQLDYQAALFESTEDITFSRENVGREIQATVSNEGIYLAAEGWLVFHEDAMATHRLTVHTPLGWEPMTQGRRQSREVIGEELVTVWDATKPADGLILIANAYHVTERDFDGITSYTYFLEDDPKLVETYQERTGVYLEMYRDMIGPYPYAKFATVENWFPTGYGMPSWTLLGGTVLRLPFIPFTSFGHEIAHNWWGNSSFVDVEGGNWCEGLTVYCADYHYKSLESDAAAAEYRKNLLKDFAAYVTSERDMTLREFKSRHSGATRAIGYGKSMMVFHMVERAIGRDAFLKAIQDVWSSHPFTQVSWDDFFLAFSEFGGQDLGWMRDQWLERTGAPVLRLESAVTVDDRVNFVLTQDEPLWTVDVPVLVETLAGTEEHVVRLDAARAEYLVEAQGAVAIHVDPDDHVFRRLHPEEIEPTLSQVLGEEAPRFVAAGAPGREFSERWTESDNPIMVTMEDDPEAHARIVVNPSQLELKRWLPSDIQLAGTLLFLQGLRIDLKLNDVVMAVTDPDQPGVTSLLVLSRSDVGLPGLADRVSHYGKYSWLIFPAKGRPQRGNWPAVDSPLSLTLDPGGWK